MVFAPALFLVGIGINARTLSTDYEFVSNDSRTECRIQAYVPYLRSAVKTLSPAHRASEDEITRIAQYWVEGAERGELRALNPIAYDDTSSDGAKGEVFDARSRIAGRLINRIPDEMTGNLHKAVTDTVLAVRLASILKYSDFVSLFNCSTEQRRAIQHIEPYVSSLDPADKQALREVLPSLGPCQKTVDVMMSRSKQLFLAWRNNCGFPPLSIEDTQLLSDVPAVIRDGNAVAMRQLRDRIFASKDDHVPTFCSSLRLGIGSQALLEADVRKLSALLK